jgi:hypothetical protein
MELYSATKKNKILFFAGKWMELEIILSEINQLQKTKSHMFLSFVEYRPNTNAALLWKTGHTNGRSHMKGVG